MLYWVNFLHIYQPPTQDSKVLKTIAEESYSLIIDLLKKYPQVKLTMNITGSLIEELQENNLDHIILGFKEKILEGQIEVAGSAMYHPILPLIPEDEVKQQIILNNEKCKEVFGEAFKPSGFFFPEMAYSKKTAQIVKDLGFKWIILDEAHFPEGKPDSSIKYEIKDNGLNVLFRNRKYSKSFPPKSIAETYKGLKENFLITAHDGEMYGHWHKDNEGSLEKIFSNKDIENITVSEYLDKLKETKAIEPREGSWESNEEEIQKNIPYALWDFPSNEIQKKLWEFQKWVYNILQNNKNDSNYKAAKHHFDRGIASCYWWWASERKIDVFSSVSWNPSEIEKGADELIKAIRSLEELDSPSKRKAEKLFSQFSSEVWEKHWDNKEKSKS